MYQKSIELLNNSQKWQLNEADAQMIKDLLENPPPATPAMQELLKLTDGIKDLT